MARAATDGNFYVGRPERESPGKLTKGALRGDGGGHTSPRRRETAEPGCHRRYPPRPRNGRVKAQARGPTVGTAPYQASSELHGRRCPPLLCALPASPVATGMEMISVGQYLAERAKLEAPSPAPLCGARLAS